MPKPNWKLIEPFMKAMRDVESAIAEADRVGERAWDFECSAQEARFVPSDNMAFQHLHDALAELHQAQRAVDAAQDRLRKIASRP